MNPSLRRRDSEYDVHPTHLFVILRFGLLALITDQLFFNLLNLFPVTTQLSVWHSGIGLAGLAGLALLPPFALYAFHTSMGGQPIFGRASLED
jgi:hypothetical protein